ncbi:hypothetical protein [Asticcacaulis endophyticus]|uniref:Uncharacterized protein n=1 Tax=Asticcacaulis endophyticus TaxID=1395890 RepID=A0A918PTL8_9CAUL|nr:hypothetical protein [Asticcacaulis endophyticus]GGZ21586.1 hypothetical protein GCM10011273_02900 [Asticcacaulis endophyticus]
MSKILVEPSKDETEGEAVARAILRPGIRHGDVASSFGSKIMGKGVTLPEIGDYTHYVNQVSKSAIEGDLTFASRTLAAQALTLDNMFTEFARRAAMNLGEYINAAETYARLALKAQANSRATLEALAKLHQPREQTVRHVHVNEGGQAVIADQIHNHTRGGKNAKIDDQPVAKALKHKPGTPCSKMPSQIKADGIHL